MLSCQICLKYRSVLFNQFKLHRGHVGCCNMIWRCSINNSLHIYLHIYKYLINIKAKFYILKKTKNNEDVTKYMWFKLE